MSMKKVFLILLSLCVITACDSDEEAADEDATVDDAGSGDSDTDTDSDSDSDSDSDADTEYPSPPYGRQVNNTVEDMRFSSIMCECTDNCDGEPRTRSAECGEPEYWSYSDFHAGEKEILVVMVSAGW